MIATGSVGEVGKAVEYRLHGMRLEGKTEAAIAFLASDDASCVTGQTLNVSGGPLMW
jgi:NAD(P)-dependent dehydrogenase (short-subunit alcohol dehydrogenase family)